ncbi:hypothetical protein D3C77_599580 [compost metagenome]
MPAIEPMLMIMPLSASTICGRILWVTMARPVMLVSIIRCQFSALLAWARSTPSASPALFTSRSICSEASRICSTAVSSDTGSVTSSASGMKLTPNSASSACSLSMRRAPPITR